MNNIVFTPKTNIHVYTTKNSYCSFFQFFYSILQGKNAIKLFPVVKKHKIQKQNPETSITYLE